MFAAHLTSAAAIPRVPLAVVAARRAFAVSSRWATKSSTDGLPDPVAAGAHSSHASGQRWGPGQKARLNVPLENTPLFVFLGFVVSLGLGTLGWNYMKSDDVRTLPGPDKDKRTDHMDPPLVKDHPPKKEE